LTPPSHLDCRRAGYSATAILPGEDAAKFEKLHRDVITELTPNGVLEDDLVETIARLLWRKQNLPTLKIAWLAQSHSRQILEDKIYWLLENSPVPRSVKPAIDPATRSEAVREADDQAREELGDVYELVEIGEAATVKGLMNELDVRARLDTEIGKCVKRLLFLRGLKSISADSSSIPPKRLAEPSNDE
jgi:hypothetical protein